MKQTNHGVYKYHSRSLILFHLNLNSESPPPPPCLGFRRILLHLLHHLQCLPSSKPTHFLFFSSLLPCSTSFFLFPMLFLLLIMMVTSSNYLFFNFLYSNFFVEFLFCWMQFWELRCIVRLMKWRKLMSILNLNGNWILVCFFEFCYCIVLLLFWIWQLKIKGCLVSNTYTTPIDVVIVCFHDGVIPLTKN